MKRFILTLALIIAGLGLNAQNIGSYIEIEYTHYVLRYTVTSLSPAECAVATKELTSESIINVLPIPESVEINGTDFSVTTIANEAFSYCYSVRKFELPNTIKTIGDKAFYYCNLATEIAIPESVRYIGASAFYSCPISEAIIPEGVTSLSNGVFHRCTELRNVEIPNTVTSIGRMTFGDCTGLSSITLPASINTIENNAFTNCKNLTSVKCYALNPPTSETIFTNVPADMIIRVPAASLDLYKATTPWNKYDLRAIETESIDEYSNSLGIYPNPTKDNLFIVTEENIETVTIYTLTGVMVGQQTMANSQQPLAINVSDLNNGVYFVKVKTENGEITRSFVKE